MEKENSKFKKKNRFFRSLFKPVTFFSEILIDGAVREISDIVKDYVIGAVNFLFSLIFFFFFWLSLNVLVVFGLNRFFNVDYFLAVLLISLLNLLCTAVFFGIAKSKFTRK